MKNVLDIEYKKGLLLDLHLPESDSFDIFVYIHGGGLYAGDRKGVDIFAEYLAERGIATASIEYRMYPDAKFPDYIEDCADAVKWIKDNISKWGKCNRIFVGGSSAGGYLSMMLCFDDKYLNAVGLKPTDIDGYIHDAGQPTAHFTVLKYRGLDSRRLIVDETSPMFYVGTAEKYSPMLFIVSDEDMFGRYEQTMLMVNVLEHFGHTEKVYFEKMHSKHCAYVDKADENGVSIFGQTVMSFINKLG